MLNRKVKVVETPQIDGEEVRKSTIDRIEQITLQMIKEIHSNNFPTITYHQHSVRRSYSSTQKTTTGQNSDDIFLDDTENSVGLGTNIASSFDSTKSLSWIHDDEKHPDTGGKSENPEVGEGEDALKLPKSSTTVDFRRQKSRKNLVLMITVMSHVHKLLINKTTRTRRSLYYELQSKPTSGVVENQRVLDDAVNHVADLLERAPWELGFIATSKGLVYGDLTLSFLERDTFSCNVPGGVLIPQNIFNVTSARTGANYVLVVEKDAVFQKLLAEDCANCLNCILITGKGYPDLNTRMLVSLLGNKIKIPVYALVDADPFGVEIMCIYRFGSLLRSRDGQKLTCPIVRWLGIHSSEYSSLGISPKPLTNSDKRRLVSLKSRSYMNEILFKELEIMSDNGKVEIEAIAYLSHRFLTSVYLPRKINAQEFI